MHTNSGDHSPAPKENCRDWTIQGWARARKTVNSVLKDHYGQLILGGLRADGSPNGKWVDGDWKAGPIADKASEFAVSSLQPPPKTPSKLSRLLSAISPRGWRWWK